MKAKAAIFGLPLVGVCSLVLLVAILGGQPALSAADVAPGPQTAAVAAYRAGFRGEGLVIAIMVAGAESGWDPLAVGVNPPTKGCPNGSRDRVMWQLNDCYMSYVPDAVAFDPDRAAVAVFTASAGGTVWTPWTTFRSGAYLEHEAVARAAAALAPSAALATIVGPNALPLPRGLLTEAMIQAGHWDGSQAWDGPVPPGTPVFAIAAGTVSSVTTDGYCGNGVIVDATGHRDTYCHASTVTAAAGAVVAAGQQIMVSGSTGERVTGPHLHLQVEVEGRKVCPQRMLLAWYRGVPFDPVQAGVC